jgi:hypothetical protein
VAELSKARVCGRSLAGVPGSNPAGGTDVCVVCVVYQFQGPRGLRRGSAADRLLGFGVQIPPGAWMFVLCVVQ